MLWLGLALAGEPAPDYQHRLAQARLFAREGWAEDAAAEVALAIATPEGAGSAEAHLLAARISWELADLPTARAYAAAALRLSAGGPGRIREEAEALVAALAADFGRLRVEGPLQGLSTRLQLDPMDPPADPELRRYVDQLSSRLRERTALPVELWLPVGLWKVNGLEVQVEAEGAGRLLLPAEAVGPRALTRLQVTRLELAPGLGQLWGEAGGLPAPAAELDLMVPAGALRMGLGLALHSSAWADDRGDLRWGAPGWDLRARLGAELPTLLTLEPALELGGGQAGGSRGPATCWLGGASLTLSHRRGGRSTAHGAGLRLGAEGMVVPGPAPDLRLRLRLSPELSFAL